MKEDLFPPFLYFYLEFVHGFIFFQRAETRQQFNLGQIDDAKEIRGVGRELIKRGVFGQFDTFFLPFFPVGGEDILRFCTEIWIYRLVRSTSSKEGRRKILMKRGIGDPFETKALSGRAISPPPFNAFPSEFYWRSCDERWMNLERQGLLLLSNEGNTLVQGQPALLRLLPFNLPFLPSTRPDLYYFPDRYLSLQCNSVIFRAG